MFHCSSEQSPPHPHLRWNNEDVFCGQTFEFAIKILQLFSMYRLSGMSEVKQNGRRIETADYRQISDPLSQNVHRADTHEAVMLIHCDSEYQQPQEK